MGLADIVRSVVMSLSVFVDICCSLLLSVNTWKILVVHIVIYIVFHIVFHIDFHIDFHIVIYIVMVK